MARTVSPAAEKNLKERFAKPRLTFPPRKIAFLAFKAERQLELWSEEGGKWRFVHAYPIQAASGMAGPKLREGDLQVPEGLYRVTVLNPASSYHLSLRLDYPNAFDLKQAKAEKRNQLGGDIYIHGKDVSIGCIALGDEAIEELFSLVSKVGKQNVEVIVAPVDFRARKELPRLRYEPPWLPELYDSIRKALTRFAV
jgi:murein L,D-transpeptidase YafK